MEEVKAYCKEIDFYLKGKIKLGGRIYERWVPYADSSAKVLSVD